MIPVCLHYCGVDVVCSDVSDHCFSVLDAFFKACVAFADVNVIIVSVYVTFSDVHVVYFNVYRACLYHVFHCFPCLLSFVCC